MLCIIIHFYMSYQYLLLANKYYCGKIFKKVKLSCVVHIFSIFNINNIVTEREILNNTSKYDYIFFYKFQIVENFIYINNFNIVCVNNQIWQSILMLGFLPLSFTIYNDEWRKEKVLRGISFTRSFRTSSLPYRSITKRAFVTRRIQVINKSASSSFSRLS